MRTSTETIIAKELVMTSDGNHGLGGTKSHDDWPGVIEKDHGIDGNYGIERDGYISQPKSNEELVRLFNADTHPLTTASLFSIGVKN